MADTTLQSLASDSRMLKQRSSTKSMACQSRQEERDPTVIQKTHDTTTQRNDDDDNQCKCREGQGMAWHGMAWLGRNSGKKREKREKKREKREKKKRKKERARQWVNATTDTQRRVDPLTIPNSDAQVPAPLSKHQNNRQFANQVVNGDTQITRRDTAQ